jgi:hypothetical protein
MLTSEIDDHPPTVALLDVFEVQVHGFGSPQAAAYKQG